jgi:hypothetical protein
MWIPMWISIHIIYHIFRGCSGSKYQLRFQSPVRAIASIAVYSGAGRDFARALPSVGIYVPTPCTRRRIKVQYTRLFL